MKRGDVVLYDFPFSDRTGSKLRPAVVVQENALNRTLDDTVLALITRTRRGLPTEVLLDITTPEGSLTGLFHTSVVDCKNLLTTDQKFVHARLGVVSSALMQQLDQALKIALDLT
jgi:mRNA interferase MazF